MIWLRASMAHRKSGCGAGVVSRVREMASSMEGSTPSFLRKVFRAGVKRDIWRDSLMSSGSGGGWRGLRIAGRRRVFAEDAECDAAGDGVAQVTLPGVAVRLAGLK